MHIFLGLIILAGGIYSIIKKKLPFIKKYDGVKDIGMFSRIIGIEMIVISIVCFFFIYFTNFIGLLELVVLIILIPVLTKYAMKKYGAID